MMLKKIARTMAYIGSIITGFYLFASAPGFHKREKWQHLTGWDYAHRGLHDNEHGIPENSMAAFQRAVDKGYGIEYLTLNFEIFNFAEKGGFTVERDLYILSFDTFQMQLERLEKELSPDTAAKVDDVVGKAKNITELLIGLSALAEKMNL